MTTFLDGPAKEANLMLKRTPRLLRVTEDGGKFDALNEIGDTPRPSETIHVYELAEVRGQIHLNMGSGRGGFYPMVTYRLFKNQPPDGVARDQVEWGRWAETQRMHVTEIIRPSEQ